MGCRFCRPWAKGWKTPTHTNCWHLPSSTSMPKPRNTERKGVRGVRSMFCSCKRNAWRGKRNAWEKERVCAGLASLRSVHIPKMMHNILVCSVAAFVAKARFPTLWFWQKAQAEVGARTFLKRARRLYLKDMSRSRWRRSLRACRQYTSSEEAIV